MTPERWQQVKEVLHGALELATEQRSAFLDQACSADHSLRQEVESLLASSDEAPPGFLQSSAMKVTLSKGTRLGDYELQSMIGSGSMGEVYRAHDRRLDRDVAIKVLPSFLSSDHERLWRFEQEARAAAALNHPNILAVLQMGTYEGAPYLVSELLEGLTLREHLRHGALPIRKALDYAVQIAHGLAAAHDKGIVHRDLKPENLFVTKNGRIKILDFGLAKLTQPKLDSIATPRTLDEQTEQGVVMGTVGYMSPEQVRGEAADHRADIFAFGAILNEMLTGRRAFWAATAVETMGAILKDDPPSVADLVPAVPPALQLIVHRCLEKDPDQRFHSASDLAFGLESLSSPSAPGIVPRTVAKPFSWKRTFAVVSTVVAMAAVAAVLWLLYSQLHWHAPGRIAQQMTIERLTHDGKTMGSTSISADGKYVVYEVDARDGKQSLWLRQIATSSAVKLIPDTDGPLGGTTFSPDGNFIYYQGFSKDEPNGALYVVPALGGVPKKVLSNINSPVTFSPDGKRLAYVRLTLLEGVTPQLVVANADGSDVHAIASGKFPSDWFETNGPSWSADGKLIAVGKVRVNKSGYSTGISLYDLAGKESVLVEKLAGVVHRIIWLTDGSGLVYLANPAVGVEGTQLWFVSYPGAEVSRITNDLNSYGKFNLGVTADGSAIITVQQIPHSTLWLASGRYDDARQITQGEIDGVYAVDATNDRILFSSVDTGILGMAVTDMNGSVVTTVSPQGQVTQGGAISHDGLYVALNLIKGEGFTIWIADSNGGNLRQLTTGILDTTPRFSADGRFVYYHHWSEGKAHLFRIPFLGGQPVQVSDLQIGTIRTSHAGDRMLVGYYDEKSSQWKVGIIAAADGKLLQTVDVSLFTHGFPFFSPDDKSLIYAETHNSVSNLWKKPVSGGEGTQLTHFPSEEIFNFVLTPDGKLVMARGHIQSDAILIRKFR